MGRQLIHALLGGALLCASAFLTGCASAPTPTRKGTPIAGTEKAPFAYERLAVRNGCFVESVHFYDQYFKKQRDGEISWAQVLEWGNQEGDLKIRSGHAVTVFAAKDQLWYYDVNFGVQPVDLPLDRRNDITDVTPKIFAKYPQFRPILARYRYDFPQQAEKKKTDHLFYHANPDIRDATKVASQLGRMRPVRVVEFDLKPGDKSQASAAAVFTFGRRVCIYFPRQGTFESPRFLGSVDDLRFIERIVQRLYPGAGNVRWQPGGYLLFPPAKK